MAETKQAIGTADRATRGALAVVAGSGIEIDLLQTDALRAEGIASDEVRIVGRGSAAELLERAAAVLRVDGEG